MAPSAGVEVMPPQMPPRACRASILKSLRASGQATIRGKMVTAIPKANSIGPYSCTVTASEPPPRIPALARKNTRPSSCRSKRVGRGMWPTMRPTRPKCPSSSATRRGPPARPSVIGVLPGKPIGMSPTMMPSVSPAESESRSVASIALLRWPTALAKAFKSSVRPTDVSWSFCSITVEALGTKISPRRVIRVMTIP